MTTFIEMLLTFGLPVLLLAGAMYMVFVTIKNLPSYLRVISGQAGDEFGSKKVHLPILVGLVLPGLIATYFLYDANERFSAVEVNYWNSEQGKEFRSVLTQWESSKTPRLIHRFESQDSCMEGLYHLISSGYDAKIVKTKCNGGVAELEHKSEES